MFRHILVPTDGSRLSRAAERTALRLAAALGAKLTALHVVAAYFPPGMTQAFPPGSTAGYRRVLKREARRGLAAFNAAARAQGAAATATMKVGGEPWEAVLKTARARKCDLIVMASHGRRGLAGLLLGSETTKVLTHSRIPVLVCRGSG